MSEQKTITLPKNMSITKRISAVSKELEKWLKSLDEPFKVGKDVIRLSECRINGKYIYSYVIDRDSAH